MSEVFLLPLSVLEVMRTTEIYMRTGSFHLHSLKEKSRGCTTFDSLC